MIYHLFLWLLLALFIPCLCARRPHTGKNPYGRDTHTHTQGTFVLSAIYLDVLHTCTKYQLRVNEKKSDRMDVLRVCVCVAGIRTQHAQEKPNINYVEVVLVVEENARSRAQRE